VHVRCFGHNVERPIHDSIRELVTLECKEHECLRGGLHHRP